MTKVFIERVLNSVGLEVAPSLTDFEEWISGASIYIGYCRYGQLGGHGFCCASMYDESEELAYRVDLLDGGDIEAIDAAVEIEKMDCWYGVDPDPAVAMQSLVAQMREFHDLLAEHSESGN